MIDSEKNILIAKVSITIGVGKFSFFRSVSEKFLKDV